jgi:hypothetical protein
MRQAITTSLRATTTAFVSPLCRDPLGEDPQRPGVRMAVLAGLDEDVTHLAGALLRDHPLSSDTLGRPSEEAVKRRYAPVHDRARVPDSPLPHRRLWPCAGDSGQRSPRPLFSWWQPRE